MPTVKFTLNEEYYKKLEEMAKQDAVSIQDYVRSQLFNLTTIFTPSEAETRALEQYKSGETFTIPQLYGDEWTLERGVAGVFGKQFFNHVNNKCSGKIEFDEMAENGRIAQYKVL